MIMIIIIIIIIISTSIIISIIIIIIIAGMFSWIVEIVLSGLKTIFKPRPNNGRTWVICFVLVFCLSKVKYKYK